MVFAVYYVATGCCENKLRLVEWQRIMGVLEIVFFKFFFKKTESEIFRKYDIVYRDFHDHRLSNSGISYMTL